jgi:hypothetical protein
MGMADHGEPNFSRLVFVRIKHCKCPDADHCDRMTATKKPSYTVWNVDIVFDKFSTCVTDYCQCADDWEMDGEPYVSGQNGLVGKTRFSDTDPT